MKIEITKKVNSNYLKGNIYEPEDRVAEYLVKTGWAKKVAPKVKKVEQKKKPAVVEKKVEKPTAKKTEQKAKTGKK